jgi:N-acetylmuramoyl-L-alanine amidase
VDAYLEKMTIKSLFFAALTAALALPAGAMRPSAPVPAVAGRPLTPVILDPGHGGDDLGAVVSGLREKDIALAFAQKLKRRLATGELPVVLTRSDDKYVTLDERNVDSVDWSGAVFVSLHLNKIKGKKAAGAVVYSYGPEKLKAWRKKRHPSVPPMPAPPSGQRVDSERFARLMSKTLRADGFAAETAKSDYYVLKNPAQPSILIELGYMNNPTEAANLVDPAYQDRMVESLAKAIEKFTAPGTVTGL